MQKLSHRNSGYALLKGQGLEIGALDAPAPVPARCVVEYCDAVSKEEAASVYSEVNSEHFVDVEYVCDLDTKGLSIFSTENFDFVILNHVIEHVANPIRVIEELFRVTRPGGLVIVSAPDKTFTYDKNRNLTSFEHLQIEYEMNVTESSDDHYVEFLRGVHPHVFNHPDIDQLLPEHVEHAKGRREHVHVWDSDSFADFLRRTLAVLGIEAECLFESTGQENRYEHFSVWKKCRE
ncbi:MAG: methyltransferase domain-containing protein [Pseudomonadota bacterium]|nr:methyltransferase domain-containing protein [Pseudomonadota bacterium]